MGDAVVILEPGDRLTKGPNRPLKLVNFHPAAWVSMCIKSKPKWFFPSIPSEDESVKNSKVASLPPLSRLPNRCQGGRGGGGGRCGAGPFAVGHVVGVPSFPKKGLELGFVISSLCCEHRWP